MDCVGVSVCLSRLYDSMTLWPHVPDLGERKSLLCSVGPWISMFPLATPSRMARPQFFMSGASQAKAWLHKPLKSFLSGLLASMLECHKETQTHVSFQIHRIDLGKVAVLQQIVNGMKDVHFHSMGCHKLFISHGPHIVLCLRQLELWSQTERISMCFTLTIYRSSQLWPNSAVYPCLSCRIGSKGVGNSNGRLFCHNCQARQKTIQRSSCSSRIWLLRQIGLSFQTRDSSQWGVKLDSKTSVVKNCCEVVSRGIMWIWEVLNVILPREKGTT